MKRITTFVILVFILGFFAQASIVVNSYQGYHSGADCSVCHNEPATAYNSTFADLEINADGVADELFWQEPQTDFHTMYIPLAGARGADHTFIRVMFAQNSTHLFVKMDWTDNTPNGTDTAKYEDSDGISIMWEMGDVVYHEGFPDGMVTESGTLDVWTWKPAPSVSTPTVNRTATYESVASDIKHDFVMNNIGLASDGNQDVTTGATYGNLGSHHENSYQVEFVRALETGDESDIQFSESGYFGFALAAFNDTSGSDHLMGFPHEVWIYGGPAPEGSDTTSTPAFGFVGISAILLASAATIVVLRSRRQNR